MGRKRLLPLRHRLAAGGSVSPNGDVKVKSGENQQFTITPEEGYQIASVLVDGSEVISGGQTGKQAKVGMSDGENNIKYYVFENVTSGHTLSASFKAVDTGDKDPDVTGGDDNDGGKDPAVCWRTACMRWNRYSKDASKIISKVLEND